MSERIQQEGNVVYGSLAGRDVNLINSYQRKPSLMSTLIESYRIEVQGSAEFQDTIESLKIYLTTIAEAEVLGLEEKLRRAGRAEEVPKAMAFKELFAKKLAKHRLSRSAQEIFAYIMGRLDLLFGTEVRPMVGKASRAEIDAAVLQKVLEPIFEELEENVLLFNYQELRGVLYYLTGNCHIWWHQ